MKVRASPTADPPLFTALVFLLTSINESVFEHCIRLTPEEEIERLKELLSLTDEQAAKALKIYGNWQDKMWKVFRSGEEREKTREATMAILRDADKQIGSLLTADQKRRLIDAGMSV